MEYYQAVKMDELKWHILYISAWITLTNNAEFKKVSWGSIGTYDTIYMKLKNTQVMLCLYISMYWRYKHMHSLNTTVSKCYLWWKKRMRWGRQSITQVVIYGYLFKENKNWSKVDKILRCKEVEICLCYLYY